MIISRKIFGLNFSVSIGFVMFLAMSFFVLLVNVGLIEGFFFMWMQSFLVGFVISIPIAVVAIPLIKNGLEKVFEVS